MAERIKDTLARAEQELSRKVQALRDELVPLERELSEVRRALAAVSPDEPPELVKIWEAADRPLSPYSLMTIKQLTLHALREQFPSGATAAELLAFIGGAYDRPISRASFSPQLSRLRDEGQVRRIGKHWRLVATKNEPLRSGSGPLAGEDQRANTRGTSPNRNKQSPGAG